MKRKHKIFLLHNIIAPYRLPLFEELVKDWDLEVKFCAAKPKGRRWSIDLNGYPFKNEVLENVHFGPFVINYTLPFKLLFKRYDLYLVSDAEEYIFSTFIVFLIAKLFKKPFIIWSEYFETDYPIYTNWIVKSDFLERRNIIEMFIRKIFKMFRIIVYNNSDVVLAFGNNVKSYITNELHVPDNKIVVGIQAMPEVLLATPIEINKGEFREKKIILYVGYLKKRKGLKKLINAFKSLKRKDAVLILVGTGEEEKNLRSLAQNEKNIRFVGYFDEMEKARYYSIADIFVLPTLHDAWGLVINEAMYFGLPIITTDAAGASELIDGNGLVVKAGDEEELRRAIEKLLDDDEMRKEMGLKSKEIMKDYTVEHAVEPFNEAIERAVMKKGK